MKTSVDLALPVLNEEKSLEESVVKILNYIHVNLAPKFNCRLIIADNGSTDNTPDISNKLERQFPEQVFYKRVEKRGVGLALKTVWGESDADILGYMDMDLATDLKHLLQALNIMANSNADILYGTRLHKDSIVHGRSFKREAISRALNMLIRNYLNVTISDGMCGFKFLKSGIYSDLFKNGAKSDGWFFCAELLIVSEWRGANIYELPVEWTDDNNSKVKIIRLATEYIKAMRTLRRQHHVTFKGN